MKTKVKDTSLEAYAALKGGDLLQPMERKIVRLLEASESPLSRRQMASIANMEINTVCGRVNSLLEKGVVEVVGYQTDHMSHRRHELIGLKDREQAA